MNLEVDSERLQAELDQLASYSDVPAPAVTRIVFSEKDAEARVFLRSAFEAEGLTVRVDSLGNTFASWQGSEQGVVATGSHFDAIPNSGKYDGTVGILGALEAVRSLKRIGFVPKKSIEIIAFTSEEPTRFGIGCLGSRVMSGSLSPDEIAKKIGLGGLTVDQARTQAGYLGSIASAVLEKGFYDAFVELHIEQGPILERESIQIGVVRGIAAPASLSVVFRGQGGHAGGVLMDERNDALCAAAEIILSVERYAKGTGSRDTVATTGICEIKAAAVNAVPADVRLEIDIRDVDLARRDQVVEKIKAEIIAVCAERNIEHHTETVNSDPPAKCDDLILGAVLEACDDTGYSSKVLVSRAYHDSLFMARIAPTGMIFIPCRSGISHRPDEFASLEDMERGVRVLALTLAKLTGS